MCVASVVARTAATFCPTNGTQEANSQSGPCTFSSALEVYVEHFGGDGVELRLIAAAHELGHIAESGLRRFEIGAHVEGLVDELRGEEARRPPDRR